MWSGWQALLDRRIDVLVSPSANNPFPVSPLSADRCALVLSPDALALQLRQGPDEPTTWLHTGNESSVLFLRKADHALLRRVASAFFAGSQGIVITYDLLPILCPPSALRRGTSLLVLLSPPFLNSLCFFPISAILPAQTSRGSSGIGKSLKQNLILVWAAQLGLNVLVESVQNDELSVFHAKTGEATVISHPRAHRPWPFEGAPRGTMIYIVDAGGKGVSREPLGNVGFTVVLASPNEKHYGQFRKGQSVESMMMPPWELSEVEAIAPWISIKGVPHDRNLETLRQRFDEVGGILRSLV